MTLGLDDDKPQRSLINNGTLSVTASSLSFSSSNIKDLLLSMIVLQVKGFEIIKGVHLEPQPFDLERDLATPTFKLKRPQLLKYYQVLTHFTVGNTKSFAQAGVQIRHMFNIFGLVTRTKSMALSAFDTISFP